MPADSPEDVIDVALKVASALTIVGAEYFIGGSVASSLQGEPRSTNDIDVVVKMAVHRIPELKATLGSDFEVDEDMLRDALSRASSANIYYLPRVTKVDIFGLGRSAFDQTEFSRRAPITPDARAAETH
jgi:hypothetical protein